MLPVRVMVLMMGGAVDAVRVNYLAGCACSCVDAQYCAWEPGGVWSG